MSGTKDSRGRDTVFFFVWGRRMALRNFIGAACFSREVTSTARRFGEGDGISGVLGQPLERNAERAEGAGNWRLHIPLVDAVGGTAQHPVLDENTDGMYLGLLGRVANEFQAILFREPVLGRGVRGWRLRLLHEASFAGKKGEHGRNL